MYLSTTSLGVPSRIAGFSVFSRVALSVPFWPCEVDFSVKLFCLKVLKRLPSHTRFYPERAD